MKKTVGNSSGTSFHGTTFVATPNQLVKIAKDLDADFDDTNDGQDKVNFDFEFETDNGDVFTVYDWKVYRSLRLDENVEWHIGSFDGKGESDAIQELEELLY